MALPVVLIRYLFVLSLLVTVAFGLYNGTEWNSIHKRMRTGSPTSVLTWDRSWTVLEDTLTVNAEEGATYFWALYVSPLGYCGLQFNLMNQGPSLHFTLWDITAVPKGSTECVATTDSEGTFVKCHYSNFHWEMNRTYRRRIEHIGNNYYTCSIIDTVTGETFTTDSMQTGYVNKNNNAFQFFEYPQEINTCDQQKYGMVSYTIPVPTPAVRLVSNYIGTVQDPPCPTICSASTAIAPASGTYSITCGKDKKAPPPASKTLHLYNSHAPQLVATINFKGGVNNPEPITYGGSSIARAVHGFARITSASDGGFITIWPSGDAARSSTLNFVPGETPTSTFTIALANAPGASANFMAYSHVPATVEFYVDGYFAPKQAAASAGTNLYLHSLPRPLRLLDTRGECNLNDGSVVPDCSARPGASGTSDAGLVGVPASAQALSLTAALISSGPAASARFGGGAIEHAKTSAPPAGTPVAIVEVSAVVRGDGTSLAWAFSGPITTALDIDAYYDQNAQEGLALELLPAPVRWIDTRPVEPSFPATYAAQGALRNADDVRSWKICDKQGDVLVATVTTVGESPYMQGFVTIWPTGAQPPVVSQAQSRGTKDQGTALGIHITCGENGYVSFRANYPTHIVLDVTAVYRPSSEAAVLSNAMSFAIPYHDRRMNFAPQAVAALKALQCPSSSTSATMQESALARINFWRKSAGQQPAKLKSDCPDLQAAADALSLAPGVSHNLSQNDCLPESASIMLHSTAIAIVSSSATGADAINTMIWSRERPALLIPEASEFGYACAESKTRRVCVARATARVNPPESFVIFPRGNFATKDFPQNALWSFASPAVSRATDISVQMSSGSRTQQLSIIHTPGSRTIFWRLKNSPALPAGDYEVTITGAGARKTYTVHLVADAVVQKADVATSSKSSSAAVVAVIVVASVAVAVALIGGLLLVLLRRRRSQQRGGELRQALQSD